METLHVVNIKCGGCEVGITDALLKAGLSDIVVSHEEQTVSFEGDADIARQVLERLGYPEAGSQAAKSLLKRAKSYATCMVGRMKKGT